MVIASRRHFGPIQIIWFLLFAILFPPSRLANAQTPAPFTSCAEIIGIPTTECEALVALYNSTDGANWANHTNWLETNAPENWYGLILSGGHVYRILLTSNNLVGTVPTELGNLTDLHSLNLSRNQLSGELPASLNNLVQLSYLYLSNNQFTGDIPTGPANLLELDLSNNQFSGTIPASIQNLSSLATLYLYSNRLSGSIPAEVGNLSNLVYLDLSHNQLSGPIPAALGSLTKLTTLYLTNNALTGSLPSSLGNLSNLIWLAISDNQISGILPSQLGNLSQLKWLIANHNNLSGSIPAELGQLSALTRLELSYNALTGELPAALGNLSNLDTLLLSANDLSGPIPDPEFTALTHLSILHFAGTQICEPDSEAFLAWKSTVTTWVSSGRLCAYPNGMPVTGRITDRNGNPVPNVTLSIQGPEMISNVTTLSDGSYSVSLPIMGTYTITPGRIGYLFYPDVLSIQVHRDRHEQNFRAQLANCAVFGVPVGQPCSNPTLSSLFQFPIHISYAEDSALQDMDFSSGLITSWFDHTAIISGSPAASIELHDGQIYSSLTESLLNGVTCFNRHCSNNLMGTGFKAPEGESPAQIYPVLPGVVTEICDPGLRGACNRDSRLGRYVLVQHSGTPYATLYAHLASIPADLIENNPVGLSSIIGTMGGSGGRPLVENYWPRQLFFITFFNGTNAAPWTPNPVESIDPFGWDPYDERPDDWKMPSVPLWKYLHATIHEAPDADSSRLSGDGVILDIPASVLSLGQIITLGDSSLGTALDVHLRSVWRSFQVKIFDSLQSWTMVQNLSTPLSVQVNYSPANLTHLDPNQVALYQLVDQAWIPLPTVLQDQVASAEIHPSGKFALAAPLLCAQDIQEPYDDGVNPYKLEPAWKGETPLDRIFDTAADQDWIPMAMIAGITYTIQITPSGENIDASLSIFAPDGSTILATADPVDTRSAQIVFAADTTGTYYLRASQSPGSISVCDAYQISQENNAKFLYLPLIRR